MATALKCPNPPCKYLFDPSRVPAGALLACPQCGMRFTLGPPPGQGSAPPPAPAGVPPPPPADPGLDFGRPTREPAAAVADEPDGEEPQANSSTKWLTVTIVAVVALLGVVGVSALFLTGKKGGGTAAAGGSRQDGSLNLAYDPPGPPWEADDALRLKFGPGHFAAYKRAEPAAYMVFGGRDFRDRSPRPSELRDALNGPLNKLFEVVNPDVDIADATWLGQPAKQAYRFRAQERGTAATMAGECFALSHKGVGYWVVAWAAERDEPAARADFQAARDKVQLLDPDRGGWRDKVATTRPFTSDKLDYKLLDPDGVWKESADKVADQDPNADLFLQVSVKRRRGSDEFWEARLLTYVLDGGGDPMADARKYVEAKMRKDAAAGDTAFEEIKGDLQGDPSNAVDATAPTARLRTKNSLQKSRSDYVVFSALKVGDKTVVAHCWCDWTEREFFEHKFVQVAGSLRAGR